MTSPGEPPQETEEPTNKPLPLQLELPSLPFADVGAEPAANARRLRARRMPRPALAQVVFALLAGTVGCAVLVVWFVPWYVRRQCIDAAAEHGVALSIGEVKIVGDGFRLLVVRAASAAVPGARAEAPEVDVSTRGLRPEKMVVRGAEVLLRGRLGAFESALARWRASPSGGQAGAWAPASLVLEGARVSWQGPIGENVRVEATDVRAQLSWHDRETELHARSDAVAVFVPGATLGPWRIDVDRAPDGSRVRVALDPGVPESCTVLVVGDADRTTSIDLVVPRSPLSHLGVPALFLGTRGEGPQVEATAHYVALGPTRSDASAKGGVYGIDVPGLPHSIDLAWEGAASGNPAAGVDVKKARLAVGPLVGAITGTLQGFDDGFRIDLAWAAGPVPCAAFVAPLGLGQPFEIGYPLRKLAEASAAKLDGTVSASVMLTFDSRDLGATKIDFHPEIACGASPRHR